MNSTLGERFASSLERHGVSRRLVKHLLSEKLGDFVGDIVTQVLLNETWNDTDITIRSTYSESVTMLLELYGFTFDLDRSFTHHLVFSKDDITIKVVNDLPNFMFNANSYDGREFTVSYPEHLRQRCHFIDPWNHIDNGDRVKYESLGFNFTNLHIDDSAITLLPNDDFK